ncbi:hypothetical protein CGZ93_08475 [Enemella dayhoffiae]|uniref:NERD domain-containing protein n=1 Tax=Enemella dayhoffiae TaxID=2016507 RepID=A0A255H2X2_9ACTN|nr:hypothetical protein CGZ93_08475 [Enemella dayhoffiae]
MASIPRSLPPALPGTILGVPGGGLVDAAWAASQGAADAGRYGEEQTARVLAPLANRPGGVTVLHDLKVPIAGARANIDHAVVCGTTLLLLDSKSWRRGFVWTLAGVTRRGRARFSAADKKTLNRAAAAVAGFLRNKGGGVRDGHSAAGGVASRGPPRVDARTRTDLVGVPASWLPRGNRSPSLRRRLEGARIQPCPPCHRRPATGVGPCRFAGPPGLGPARRVGSGRDRHAAAIPPTRIPDGARPVPARTPTASALIATTPPPPREPPLRTRMSIVGGWMWRQQARTAPARAGGGFRSRRVRHRCGRGRGRPVVVVNCRTHQS